MAQKRGKKGDPVLTVLTADVLGAFEKVFSLGGTKFCE